ncbi:MAG TPA: hypothetical protein VKB92_15825, partial [Myxococcales bacterium]|nr:hypothetical protein [Myxococcales bacterium]
MRAAGAALLLCLPAAALAQAQPAIQGTSAAARPAPLTLAQLQELARKNDPRTAQARAHVAGAQGKHDEVYWASRFPTINTTVS